MAQQERAVGTRAWWSRRKSEETASRDRLDGGGVASTGRVAIHEPPAKRFSSKPNIFDSIINKTPLSYRTNRIIGGVSPSEYLGKLEAGNATTPPIVHERLDGYLTSHLINPTLLRADSFDAFMVDRQKRLLALIERATGRAAYSGDVREEGEEIEADEDTIEAELTIAAA